MSAIFIGFIICFPRNRTSSKEFRVPEFQDSVDLFHCEQFQVCVTSSNCESINLCLDLAVIGLFTLRTSSLDLTLRSGGAVSATVAWLVACSELSSFNLMVSKSFSIDSISCVSFLVFVFRCLFFCL